MAVTFKCSCGQILEAEDEHAGMQAQCPGCGESITIPSPEEKESREQKDLLSTIVKCQSCGQPNKPGRFRCTKCNHSLCPTFLRVIIYLGLILLTLFSIQSLTEIPGNPEAIFPLLLYVSYAMILIGLHYGRYWAWRVIHVVWIAITASSAIQALVIDPRKYLGSTVVQAVIIVLFWLYFHTDKVKAFCSVGRATASNVKR